MRRGWGRAAHRRPRHLLPLELCRLIKWTSQAYPSDLQQQLLPLLEKCTRQLQDVEAYKKDVRYLRVWIQYVRLKRMNISASRPGSRARIQHEF